MRFNFLKIANIFTLLNIVAFVFIISYFLLGYGKMTLSSPIKGVSMVLQGKNFEQNKAVKFRPGKYNVSYFGPTIESGKIDVQVGIFKNKIVSLNVPEKSDEEIAASLEAYPDTPEEERPFLVDFKFSEDKTVGVLSYDYETTDHSADLEDTKSGKTISFAVVAFSAGSWKTMQFDNASAIKQNSVNYPDRVKIFVDNFFNEKGL